MPPTRTVFFLLIVLVFFPVSGESQEQFIYSKDAEAEFSRGVSLFGEGKYVQAADVFDKIVQSHPFNQRTTASYLMRGKAFFRLENYVNAARTLSMFLDQYPSSSYVIDAEYTLGLTYIRIRRYEDAVHTLRSAWRHVRAGGGTDKLLRDIVHAIDMTIDEFIPLAGVRSLLRESTDRVEAAFFWLKVGEKESGSGNITAAIIAADTLQLNYPDAPYGDRIAVLRLNVGRRSSVKLGALIPLMAKEDPSAAKEIGTDIHDGIVFAVEEFAKDPVTKVKVTLETRDTERDPLVATRVAQELVNDKDIVAILGPVFSNTTSAVVGLANAHGIPLVTPTANSNGIAATGPYIFQASPDYETRGRAMARYAVTTKGYKNLTILAPMDTHGKFMADAFASEAMRLGAKIVATEWYQRGATDLKIQLANLRRAGMLEAVDPYISFSGKLNQADIAKLAQLGVRLKTLDSLIERGSIVNATAILGPRARARVDSLGINALYSDPRIDSLEYPVTGIDGMYVPISTPEEIAVVSSQVVYFNFQTQLLGSGEWNSLPDLDANKRYCKGVVFESDNIIRPDDSLYASFVGRYYDRYKKRPSKNTLYGYDVAKLVLMLIHQGATTRESMTKALGAVRNYRGLHSNFGFSMKRVNSWLHILHYTADEVKQIDEVDVDQPFERGYNGEQRRE